MQELKQDKGNLQVPLRERCLPASFWMEPKGHSHPMLHHYESLQGPEMPSIYSDHLTRQYIAQYYGNNLPTFPHQAGMLSCSTKCITPGIETRGIFSQRLAAMQALYSSYICGCKSLSCVSSQLKYRNHNSHVMLGPTPTVQHHIFQHQIAMERIKHHPKFSYGKFCLPLETIPEELKSPNTMGLSASQRIQVEPEKLSPLRPLVHRPQHVIARHHPYSSS